MAFDNNRFTNFAKYDLTINKNFYRNITLATLVGTIGIATFMFLMRYLAYEGSGGAEWVRPDNPAHYNSATGSCIYIVSYLVIMMSIFGGCWAHNLRNKQGRIIELTLPATNLEKFLWHLLLMLGGGFLVCLISLLIADGINCLLTLCVFGSEDGFISLTAHIAKTLAIQPIATDASSGLTIDSSSYPDANLQTDLPAELNVFLWGMGAFAISALIAGPICYANFRIIKFNTSIILSIVVIISFIYKFNIIVTYIVLMILGFLASIIFVIALGTILSSSDIMYEFIASDDKTTFAHMGYAFIACSIVQLLAAAGLIFWSYRLYTKAQIITSLHK